MARLPTSIGNSVRLNWPPVKVDSLSTLLLRKLSICPLVQCEPLTLHCTIVQCEIRLWASQSAECRAQSTECIVQSAIVPNGRVPECTVQSLECQSARVHSDRVLTRVPPLITSSGRMLRENIAIVFFRPALQQIL